MIRVFDPLDRRPVPGRGLAVSILAIVLMTSACSGGTASPSAASVASPDASFSPAATNASSSSNSPAPLPGGRLAYMRLDANDQWSVFTANPDGTDEQALLSSWAQLPRWSPDGRRLSVAVESPQGLVFVGLVNPDGSDYVPFDSPDPTLNLGCFVWSPDASRLACEGWDDADPTRNGLYTVRASDGGDLIRVTTSPDGAHDIPVDYSPGGLQIVLVRAIDEATTSPLVVNVDGSDEHALAGRAGRFSPDGKTILTDAEGSLLLVPIDGGQPRPIMIDQAPGEFAFGGAWSPDGEWLVFSLDLKAGTHSDIYIMRKDGSDLYQVTDTPDQDEEFGGWGVAAP